MNEESLENVVNTIELLQSMYFDDEFQFRTPDDTTLFDQLTQHSQSGTLGGLASQLTARTLWFQVRIPLKDHDNNADDELVLVVDGGLALANPQQQCQLTISSSANHWLDRAAHDALVTSWDKAWQAQMEEHGTEMDRGSHVMMILQQAPVLAEPMVQQYTLQQQQRLQQQQQQQAALAGPIKCIREWLWLPMIYTKEKRGHIVDWAPAYGITGFLFAGKPGCLCLEGSEKSVASFINDIKTISWADIPAGHKKISTKYQERFVCDSMEVFDQGKRKFKNMQELKFDTSGKFRNHNDLDMLKKWMTEYHADDAFGHLFDYE